MLCSSDMRLKVDGEGGHYPNNPDDGRKQGRGDVFVSFEVEPHAVFVRKEANIYTSQDISMPQALLGDKIDIETLAGQVEVKVRRSVQA